MLIVLEHRHVGYNQIVVFSPLQRLFYILINTVFIPI